MEGGGLFRYNCWIQHQHRHLSHWNNGASAGIVESNDFKRGRSNTSLSGTANPKATQLHSDE
jgi:hypothetical protein